MNKTWRLPLAVLLVGVCVSCDSGTSTQYIVDVWIDSHQYSMSQHTRITDAANGLLLEATAPLVGAAAPQGG